MYYDPVTDVEFAVAIAGGISLFLGIKGLIYALASKFGIEYRTYPRRGR